MPAIVGGGTHRQRQGGQGPPDPAAVGFFLLGHGQAHEWRVGGVLGLIGPAQGLEQGGHQEASSTWGSMASSATVSRSTGVLARRDSSSSLGMGSPDSAFRRSRVLLPAMPSGVSP